LALKQHFAEGFEAVNVWVRMAIEACYHVMPWHGDDALLHKVPDSIAAASAAFQIAGQPRATSREGLQMN
jgi:hypothetical protein